MAADAAAAGARGLAPTFAERSAGPARDSRLHRALDNASQRFLEKRAQAFAAFPEGEALRDRARAIKAATLARLDEHLEQLERQLVAAGAIVHWCDTTAQARNAVIALARAHGARTVVKGKSMVSEEIELNAALEAEGIAAVETDLGEYIVQLAGEPPSHIITPAIHKSQRDIAALFHAKLGSPLTASAEVLTEAARVALRERFCRADLGVTGVNFAVAETGTLVVVENEGNARLALSMPRVHVALMGIEKVVPRLADLDVFLRLLPRSATGQKCSAYVSWLTGPRGAGEDGPEELHVILLDNGRSALLAHPALREALYCIRCGACLNACPVYRKVGGHAYASPYPGPIGAIVSPEFQGMAQAAELPFASSLCGACREICPVRIDIPHLLLRWRERLVAAGHAGDDERRWVRWWSRAMQSRWGYAAASFAVRTGALAAARNRRLRARSGAATAWARYRALPEPPPQTFRHWWRTHRVARSGG
jgi:L-lactate dehydrogenase complex protein LldF